MAPRDLLREAAAHASASSDVPAADARGGAAEAAAEVAREQLARWTREHGAYLQGLARKLCRAQLDPEDLVQDVLEKLLRTPVPAGANERAWVARVMHNLFIDKLRRRDARREDPSDALEQLGATLDERPWWTALTEDDVRAQVARLPAEQRATFELFAFAGASYDDIAARLGIAKGTVGTRIMRARQRIREQLVRERGGADE